MIHGTPLPNVLLKMSVVLDGEANLDYLAKMIADNLRNTLKSKSFCRVDVTCTTLDDQPNSTTIVTYYEQKKIPEKNGAT